MVVLAYALQFGQPHTVDDWSQPASDWIPLPPPGSEVAARAWLFFAFAGLAAVHYSLLRGAVRIAPTRAIALTVLGGSALLSLLSAANTIAFSGDVYSYIVYGRMAAEYGLNPMVDSPSMVADDPFYGYISDDYTEAVSVYGPHWNLLSVLVTYLAEALGGSLGVYVLAYRVVMTVGLVVLGAAVWTILGRKAPDYQVAGTLLVAWNPLVLTETSALHNDLVMAALVVLGLLLLVQQRPYWALAVMVTAVMVKWIAVVPLLIMMLAWLMHLPRQLRVQAMLKAAMVGVVVVLPPLLYFGDPVNSLLAPFSEAGSGVRNTPAELVLVGLTKVFPAVASDELSSIVQLISRLAVASVLAGALFLAWRRPSLRWSVMLSVGALLLVLLLAPRFWPWYVLWPLALAPFVTRPLRLASLVLSYTAPLIYVLYPSPDGATPLTTGRSLFVFVPPIVAFILALRPTLGRRAVADAAEWNSDWEAAGEGAELEPSK